MNFKKKVPSEKKFGLTFAIIFFLIAVYAYLNEISLYLEFSIIAFILIIIALFYPKLLKYPNMIWYRFGILLNKIVSPFILIIIYFLLITPTNLIMRILKKDLLNEKINVKKESYWLKKTDRPNSMDKQY